MLYKVINGKSCSRQKGFTLIELILGLAISGFLIAAIGTTLSRTLIENARVRNHNLAIRQVQNVGYWVSRDAVGAQMVVADSDPDTPDFLILRWTDWDNVIYEAVYYFDGNQLYRRHTRSTGGTEEMIVGRHIDAGSTTFENTGPSWVLSVQATVDGFPSPATEYRSYEVLPRPLPT